MGQPTRAVFRLPVVSLLFPFLLFIAVTPLATFRPYLLPLYLIPVLALVYIGFTRTSANGESITTVGPGGIRRIPWGELDQFEFHGPRWAIAVRTDGRRVRLPMVRPRDLPRLAEVSGGRLTLTPRSAPAAAAPKDAAPKDAAGPVETAEPAGAGGVAGPVETADAEPAGAAGLAAWVEPTEADLSVDAVDLVVPVAPTPDPAGRPDAQRT